MKCEECKFGSTSAHTTKMIKWAGLGWDEIKAFVKKHLCLGKTVSISERNGRNYNFLIFFKF